MKLRDFMATYDFSDGQDIALMELGRTVEIIRDDPVSLQCAYSHMERDKLRPGQRPDHRAAWAKAVKKESPP